MILQEIPLDQLKISGSNSRKDLVESELEDSKISDLAASIEKKGLLNPVTVVPCGDGYEVVAGQRRFLAFQRLGRPSIPAIVRHDNAEAAEAVSLTENLHRSDMAPLDKARGFASLMKLHGDDIQAVSEEISITPATVRRYLKLLDLDPGLQDMLEAGDGRQVGSLSALAAKITNPVEQRVVWNEIKGFNGTEQQAVIKRLRPDLENLGDLKDMAIEGSFNMNVVRNCPWDCSSIPKAAKQQVADLMQA